MNPVHTALPAEVAEFDNALSPLLAEFASRGTPRRPTDHLPFAFSDGGENVTVQVGSTAYLHCPVINLGERDVRSGSSAFTNLSLSTGSGTIL